MAENEKLQERLRRMQKPEARPPWWRRMALPAGMLATGLAGGAYVATVQPSETAAPPPMQTSEVSEFQNDTGLSGFTLTEDPAALVPEPALARTEARIVPDPQAQADAEAARAELAKARADLEAARAELDAARASPATDPAEIEAAFGSPAEIGRIFPTDHLLAFEITSIVLLVADVGGVNLGTRTRDEEALEEAA